MAKLAADFRRAFPDARWHVDLVFGEDDFVAARWTATGTHTGDWGDVAPTGRSAMFSGLNIFRFSPDGKVAELWNHRDDLGLMEQVGAPAYAGATPSATTEN
jgi:predicted ester cyclase